MQLSTMYGLVSQRLAEGASGPVFYPTGEIIAGLNEAQRFFVLLTLGLEVTSPWSVPESTAFTHMLTVFPDWIACLRITDASGAKVRPSRLEDLAALDSGWMNASGAPYRYADLGVDLVAIYGQPPAEGTVLSVTYARAPAPLVLDTDVPEIPGEYHPALVDYGIYRPRQVEGGLEFEKALPYLSNFLDAAQRYGNYVRARNLGSRYDKVPFELENFHRSLLMKFRPDVAPARRVPET